MDQQQQQPVSVNVEAIQCEAFFAKILAERNAQLMAAVGEVQALREQLEASQKEIEALKGGK